MAARRQKSGHFENDYFSLKTHPCDTRASRRRAQLAVHDRPVRFERASTR